MIPQFFRVIFILIEVVVLFNLLIIVHELGHFLAARWRGLFVEGFGVWFGKPIWKKTINGVQYSLNRHRSVAEPDLDAILAADQWAREESRKVATDLHR